MQKQGIWIFWVAAVAAWLFGSGMVATVGKWATVLTLVAHVVEFVVNRSVFERAGGSMGHHFVQTMIYGLFHWKPIKEGLDAEASSAASDS
ncbi:MAG: hypothetical protein OEV20_11385 [Actinomycetota bacterium]|nr:hypothetical protein [Actinomycetota bacterium]